MESTSRLVYGPLLALILISVAASGQPAIEGRTFVQLSPSELQRRATFQVQPKFDCDEEIDRFYSGEKLELFVRVSSSGEVESVRSLNGPSLWKDKAIAAVKQWRFKPFGNKPATPFSGRIVFDHPKECKGYRIASVEYYRAEIREDSWLSYYRLGRRLLIDSPRNGTIAAFERAVAINPNAGIAWYHLGEAYHWAKKYDKAAECYRKAIEVTPGLFEAYFALAIRYEVDKNPDLAVETYNTILRLRPDLNVKLWAYDQEVRIFERISRLDAQIDMKEKYYDTLLEAEAVGSSQADKGNAAFALSELGGLYTRNGQREKGIVTLFRAFGSIPGELFGFEGLLKQAALYRAQGDVPRSSDLFERIMAALENHLKANLSSRGRAELLVAKARVYSEQGMIRQAIQNLIAASHLNRNDIKIHEALRDNYLRIGDNRAANDEARTIKRISSKKDSWN